MNYLTKYFLQIRNMWNSNHIFHLTLILLFVPALANAQLKELEVQPFNPENRSIYIPIDYPEKAAIIIRSSITNLQFESNLQIIATLGSPAQGEYRLIVDPVVQSIRVSATGYLTERIPIRGLTPNSVQYYSVEPKTQVITDKGTLLVRTIPEGATLELDGIPGSNISNHTYEDILAQTYNLRVTLEYYKTEERLITVKPSTPEVVEIELIPTFGSIVIGNFDKDELILFLQEEGSETEYRRSFEPSVPLRLNVGTYNYRIASTYYKDVTGTFTLGLGETIRLNTPTEPTFGILRVVSNVENIELSSVDNVAPPSLVKNQINLENGLRTVSVSAPGYVSQEITVQIGAGQLLEERVDLETLAQRDERLRKENLPKGILKVGADVEADIFVNGQLYGKGDVTLTLVPDRYDVEFRHPLGTEIIQVSVYPSDLTERTIQLRPKRSRAFTLSLFMPGIGHLYRQNTRGLLYMGLIAGSGVATYLAIEEQSLAQQNYDVALEEYNNANSTSLAIERRADLLTQYQVLDDANSRVMLTAGVTAGLYALQLLDVLITRPKYGFRSKDKDSRAVGVRFEPTGITLTARF